MPAAAAFTLQDDFLAQCVGALFLLQGIDAVSYTHLIFDWARTHVTSTLYICWAAQAGLYHHYGVPKYALDKDVYKRQVLGLTPVIGIPLPFFSYGGSSLWGFTILLFIFLRIDAGRNRRI